MLPARVARLRPGDARRAHRDRRGRLVGSRQPARARRLDRPAPGRRRAPDPQPARGRRSRPAPSRPSCSRPSTAGGAYFAAQLRQATGAENEQSVIEALWSLTWAGRVTNDTFAPVRMLLGGGSQAHRVARKTPRARLYRGATAVADGRRDRVRRARPRSAVAGRCCPHPRPTPAVRATAAASLLLDRYGVVTRGAVQAEGLPGGFAQAYRVLAGFEEAGHCRRGYVDREARRGAVRGIRHRRPTARVRRTPPTRAPLRAVTLAATDPANPYGAALAWPPLDGVAPPAGPQGRRTGRAGRRRARALSRARRQVGARVHGR